MRLNTIVTLGASAAFGLMAVFLAKGWINSAVESEFGDTSAQSPSINMPAQKMSAILVADTDFQFGDVISPKMVKVVQYPEDAIPFESFKDFQGLIGYDPDNTQNIIALTSIRKNEPILPHKISGPNGKGSLSARIRPGFRAASIRVDAVTGVSGFIVPGDLVDVIYTALPNPGLNSGANLVANSGSNLNSTSQTYSSDIILQSVQVLGIDQNQSDETDQAKLAKTVTLEVSHSEAQRLSVATQTGHLSLILRALGETSPAITQAVTSAQFTQKQPPKPRSYAKAASQARPKITAQPKTDNIAQITIIRGEQTESVSVLSEAQTIAPDIGKDLAGG